MKKALKDYTYINTGKVITMEDLIKSEDVTDRSIIQVFDGAGKFITKGNWFQDNILGWASAKGTARKAGTGLTVSFNLV